MRNVPGRRHGDRGDAVSGGRGIDLRGVPRAAVQVERSGSAVSLEKCARRAGDDGAGGAGIFRECAEGGFEAAGAERNWAGIFAAGAVGDDFVGRRGTTLEVGGASYAFGEPGDFVYFG